MVTQARWRGCAAAAALDQTITFLMQLNAGNDVEVELICWKQPQDDGVPSHDAALPHWRSGVF